MNNDIPQELDEIARAQYDRAFQDLSPSEKIQVLGGAGDRVRRESPYEYVEDFEHLGVQKLIYHTLIIEVIDDVGNVMVGVPVEIDGQEESTTDSDGIFRITLPRDQYDIYIEVEDYTPYSDTIDLESETEITAILDYELFRDDDNNSIYWGTAEEPANEEIDTTFAENLEHTKVDNDITFEFTVDAGTDEHVWFIHPARLGKVHFAQEIGDFEYEDTYYGTFEIDGEEGTEDYEVHMTPEHSLGEVTIETKEHTE